LGFSKVISYQSYRFFIRGNLPKFSIGIFSSFGLK
jgi:hypothetical protein